MQFHWLWKSEICVMAFHEVDTWVVHLLPFPEDAHSQWSPTCVISICRLELPWIPIGCHQNPHGTPIGLKFNMRHSQGSQILLWEAWRLLLCQPQFQHASFQSADSNCHGFHYDASHTHGTRIGLKLNMHHFVGMDVTFHNINNIWFVVRVCCETLSEILTIVTFYNINNICFVFRICFETFSDSLTIAPRLDNICLTMS